MYAVFGIAVLLLAGWQFYAFYNALVTVRRKGNQMTSAFSSLGIWYGFTFGLCMLVLGLQLIF